MHIGFKASKNPATIEITGFAMVENRGIEPLTS
jgi:hypothetical protein